MHSTTMLSTRRWTVSLTIAAAVIVTTITTVGADWPRYGGTKADFHQPGVKLRTDWEKNPPKTLWTVKVSDGYGGAAISDSKVYFLDRQDGSDVVRCFDIKTGNEIWKHAYKAPGRFRRYDGARSTPTIDGQHVYTVGPFGHLHCLKADDGKVVWSKHLEKDLGAGYPKWAHSQSPLVHGGHVIVNLKSKKHGLAALDKTNGNVVWRSKALGDADGYTSPVIATVAGVEQIVTSQSGCIAGLDPKSGNILWKYTGYNVTRVIPNPVITPDGHIFITSGYGKGSAMIRITREGKNYSVSELFQTRDSGSKIAPAIHIDGHIYTNVSAETRGGLQCFKVGDKLDVKWETKREPDLEMGSLLQAGDHLLAMDGRSGTLYLIKPSPEKYIQVASARVLGGGQIWGPMAITKDGKLILRDMKQLKCIDIGAGSDATRMD